MRIIVFRKWAGMTSLLLLIIFSVADFNFRERQREMVFQYIAIITIKY